MRGKVSIQTVGRRTNEEDNRHTEGRKDNVVREEGRKEGGRKGGRNMQEGR